MEYPTTSVVRTDQGNSEGMSLRFDRFVLDAGSRRRAEDGALIVTGRLSRTGIQSYNQGDGTRRREFRPDAEVFDADSIASFDGVTITDLHPESGVVTPDTFNNLSKGHIQNPRKDGDHLAADFYIHDANLIQAVEGGHRSELSAGYFAVLDLTPGEYHGQKYDAIQRRIRANHVALLPKGMARAGRSAKLLLDSNGNQLPPQIHVNQQDGGPLPPPEDRNMDEFTVIIDGITYVLKGDATARQVVPRQIQDASALVRERDGLQAKLDAATEENAKLKADLDAAQDPARIDSMVKERAELIEKARKLGGKDLDCSGSTRAIQERALATRKIDCSGKSDDYIAARFDAALEALPAQTGNNGTTINDAVSRLTANTPQPHQRVDHSLLRAARARYIARQGGN